MTISGTGEPGATVVVELNGNTETTTVDPDGNWTVEFVGQPILVMANMPLQLP